MSQGQTASFNLDGVRRVVSVAGSPPFVRGEGGVLSSQETDLSWGQPWYPAGFAVLPFLEPAAFSALRSGIEQTVGRLVSEQGQEVRDFRLEHYHRHVLSDAAHMRVVQQTRDLFPADFGFDIVALHARLSAILGCKLTDVCPRTGKTMHIIVRINRPRSGDFNPPHKDAYEAVDRNADTSPFVNFWIPIAGVDERSALPVSPGSHTLPESQVLRTHAGAVLDGRTYRVRMVREWGGRSNLERVRIHAGEVLVFSAFLVHGLAMNDHDDQTRVALEFRLFRDRG